MNRLLAAAVVLLVALAPIGLRAQTVAEFKTPPVGTFLEYTDFKILVKGVDDFKMSYAVSAVMAIATLNSLVGSLLT